MNEPIVGQGVVRFHHGLSLSFCDHEYFGKTSQLPVI